MIAHSARPYRVLALATFLLFVLLAAAYAPQAGAQATRTWVSGVGDDVNPCSRTAPCKTLAGAISKTAERGEINAIDSGGFGALTITKAITIDLRPHLGGVLVAGANGIVVNAGLDDDVVLRGIDFFGAGGGPAGCPQYSGLSGVRLLAARTLRVDDSRISQMGTSGLDLVPATGDADVFVNRVDIAGSCGPGINAAPVAPHALSVFVRDSTITNTATGVLAGAGAKVRLADTTLFGNGTGLLTAGNGIIDSYSGTQISGNDTNGTPTNNFAALTTGPPGAAGPAGANGAPGAKGDAAIKLLLASASASITARAGSKVTLKYVATASAKTTLLVRQGKKTVATISGRTRSGRNTISWNGKTGKKPATAGAYRLSLNASASDGQKAGISVALKLIKR